MLLRRAPCYNCSTVGPKTLFKFLRAVYYQPSKSLNGQLRTILQGAASSRSPGSEMLVFTCLTAVLLRLRKEGLELMVVQFGGSVSKADLDSAGPVEISKSDFGPFITSDLTVESKGPRCAHGSRCVGEHSKVNAHEEPQSVI